MIKIDIDDRGIDRLMEEVNRMESRVTLAVTEIIALGSMMIRSKMKELLGDKAKHFGVSVEPGQENSLTVVVGPVDDIGNFIYHGTKPHIISSPNAMYIGGGVFAKTVLHPGTESMKDEIRKIVSDAMRLAAMAVVATR